MGIFKERNVFNFALGTFAMILAKIVRVIEAMPYSDASTDLICSPAAFIHHNTYNRMFDAKSIDSLKSSRMSGDMKNSNSKSRWCESVDLSTYKKTWRTSRPGRINKIQEGRTCR